MVVREQSADAEIGGKSWHFSTGVLAPQADGAVSIRVGDTVVMATAVMGKEPREGVDFLPLIVDYEEKLYAAGKIKGSRWVKREGRPTDEAILTARVIDRSFRPMFDSRVRTDIQVIATVLSVDGVNDPDMLALNAASAALEISDIPWDGPVAGVRVGKIDGQFVLNPSFEEIGEKSTLDLIVAGTAEHIIMVEAGAKQVPEEEILQGISFAQGEIKKIIAAIAKLRQQAGREKRPATLFEPDAVVAQKVKAYEPQIIKALYETENKTEREEAYEQLWQQIVDELAGGDEAVLPQVRYHLEKLVKEIIQSKILKEEKRVDSRKLDEIRPISIQTGLLPRVHGSGLFQRGLTQVLTTVTLGGPGLVQLLEDIDTAEERKKHYIHHYNFPPFSTGETSPLRSPGRREIGHGALAERALLPVIPPKEEFPYTLRLVSEVLSSNGSTSMAATCGSTLALMDAGVGIKAPVSGIAMGLVMGASPLSKGEGYKILSDIQGLEDANGHMDFKVAGTKDGITALQMDIKVKGLTLNILRDALSVAKTGRLYILEKMLAAIPAPRPEMSQYAPRITAIKIDPAKIRDVIGPGGKVINKIIEETGVEIDIEDDGTVMVTATNGASAEKALEWIRNLTRVVEVGEEFTGRVTRIMDFGAFVEILPGQEGMVHISELAPYRVNQVTDEVKIGDMVKVMVKEIDELGRINLSRRALLPQSRPSQDRLDDYVERGRPSGRPPRKRFIAKR